MEISRRILPTQFSQQLLRSAESGMGYQIVTVALHDGRRFQRVCIVDAHHIASADGRDEVPFEPSEIASITLTHDKSRAA